MSDKPPAYDGQIIRESYSKNSSKARCRKELVTCKTYSLSCASHHTSMWGLRSRDPNFITLLLRYSWISKKPLTLHGTLACYVTIQIEHFGQHTQAYYLITFQQKIRSYEWRRNVHDPGAAISILAPTPYRLYINNATPPNPRVLPSPLYWWHVPICNR
jgi:hypothetical protein